MSICFLCPSKASGGLRAAPCHAMPCHADAFAMRKAQVTAPLCPPQRTSPPAPPLLPMLSAHSRLHSKHPAHLDLLWKPLQARLLCRAPAAPTSARSRPHLSRPSTFPARETGVAKREKGCTCTSFPARAPRYRTPPTRCHHCIVCRSSHAAPATQPASTDVTRPDPTPRACHFRVRPAVHERRLLVAARLRPVPADERRVQCV